MLKKSHAPFIRFNLTVENVMYEVLLSLLPIIIFATYFFGIRVIIHLILANLCGFIFEYLFSKLFKRDLGVFDGSTFITCTLLVLTLPHTAPYWISIIGAFIAIIFGKMIFGGLGTNIFNPALLSRVILSLAFPAKIFMYKNFDGTAGATIIPLIKYQSLEQFQYDIGGFWELFKNLFLGINKLGSMGETSFFLILLAAIFLIIRKHILLRVPLIIILVTLLMGLLLDHNPFVYITYGGVFFAAVFMATDMVTSPYTKKGLIIYSIGIGVLTAIIREFTSQQEGVAYAILIMNIFAPMIDEFCQSRVYGTKKENKDRNGFLISISILSVFILIFIGINSLDLNLKPHIDNKKKILDYKIEKSRKKLLNNMEIQDKEIKSDGITFKQVFKDKKLTYYFVENRSRGYSKAKIYYSLLINLDGEIESLEIIDHKETRGLGAQIEKKEWKDLWKGRTRKYKFDKEIDGFSGATYTALNLYNSINYVLEVFSKLENNEDIKVED